MAENIKFPSKVVIDASVVLALLLPDERNKPKAVSFLQQYEQGGVNLISTQLLNFEVLNGIRTAVLRKRIKSETAKKLVNSFLGLEIKKEEINFSRAFEYSLDFSISVYDASYLALAKKKDCPLVTSDKKLFQKTKRKFKDIILF